MTTTALAIATICTITFYAGMTLARRSPSKLYAALFRLGGLILCIALFGIIPVIIEADLRVSELAGRYFFYLMLGGAFVYKFLLVRLIPLPRENNSSQ